MVVSPGAVWWCDEEGPLTECCHCLKIQLGNDECEEQTAELDIQCLCRTLNAEVTTMIPSSYTVLFTYSHVRT